MNAARVAANKTEAFVVLQVTGPFAPISTLSMASGSSLERLMIVNVSLVGFNMLSARKRQ